MKAHFTYFKQYLGFRIYLLLGITFLVSLADTIGLGLLIQTISLLGDQIPDGNDRYSRAAVAFLRNSGVLEYPALILLFLVIAFCFKGILRLAQIYYDAKVRAYFISRLRRDLFSGLARLRFGRFTRINAGKLQNILTGESARLSSGFAAFFSMIQQFTMMLAYGFFAMLINPLFVLFCAVGTGSSHLLYRYFNQRTSWLSRRFTKSSHGYQSILIQSVKHFFYLRGSGAMQALKEDIHRRVNTIEERQLNMSWYQALTFSLREPIVILVIAAALYLFVVIDGQDIKAIAVVILLMYRAMSHLQTAETAKQRYYTFTGSIESVINLNQEFKQGAERRGGLRLSEPIHSITFEKVQFRHEEGGADFHFDFHSGAGRELALVGESGSGKSTIIGILLGLHEPHGGRVLINGIPLDELDLSDYRKRIGLISQDTFAFNDTVFNNVTNWSAHGPESEQRFWRVMDAVRLGDTFRNRSEGFQTVLGDNGIKVSGGQRQRISIARELYKDFELIILDEATAALDTISARRVKEEVDRRSAGKIRVTVSHKIESVRKADQILLLANGQIEARGTYAELAAGSADFRAMIEHR